MSMMRIRSTIAGLQGLPGLSTVYANGASSTPVTADATDMVARVRAYWLALIGVMATGEVITVSTQVDLIDPADGALVGGLVAASVANVSPNGGTALPLASMALLVLNTGQIVNGRRLQGRSFVGPLSATTNNAGQLGAAQATTIQVAATATLTGSTASVPVVWHRPKLPGPAGGSAHPVTGYVVRSSYAVLRSRRD